MDDDRDIYVYGGIRRIVLAFKHNLEILAEIKREHDTSLEKLSQSLCDYEIFLKDKYGIDVELNHLLNHADYLDEQKIAIYRKRILDYGNTLKREMETI